MISFNKWFDISNLLSTPKKPYRETAYSVLSTPNEDRDPENRESNPPFFTPHLLSIFLNPSPALPLSNKGRVTIIYNFRSVARLFLC